MTQHTNSHPIYLDYAAATPMSDAVLAAMRPFFQDNFYNPSATYLASKHVAMSIAEARHQVARCVGLKPHEITFTAGGTESNNLAIHGVLEKFQGSHVIVSAVEHDSVLEPARLYSHSIAPVDQAGIVDIDALIGLVQDSTVLVSVMLVNNEVGTLQPLSEIARKLEIVRADRRARGIDHPLYFHTDACQAPNFLDVHMPRLGVDLMSLNGGKIYGPKQSGILAKRSHVQLNPQILGGGQERGLRSGTENVAASIGFATALTNAQDHHTAEAKRVSEIRDRFINELTRHFPTVVINGSHKQRVANNVHVTFPDVDNERLMMELDERGIMCAVGSACSASNDEPSHVLLAMGLTEQHAQSSLRFTLGKLSTHDDIDRVVHALISILSRS